MRVSMRGALIARCAQPMTEGQSLLAQCQSCDAVIAHHYMSGLCNRLRGSASLRVVSELLGVPFVQLWEPNWACPARFEDLFRAEPAVGSEQSIGRFRDPLIVGKGGTFPDVKAGFSPNRFWALFCRRLISEEEFCARAHVHYRGFVPLAPIAADIAAVSEDPGHSLRVGVHMRLGDFYIKKKGEGACSYPDVIWARMRDCVRQDSTQAFFFATDDPDAIRHAERQFPGRISRLDRAFTPQADRGPSPEKQRLDPVVDAVKELVILSRCRMLIGTRGSAFSGFAAKLGGIPAVYC